MGLLLEGFHVINFAINIDPNILIGCTFKPESNKMTAHLKIPGTLLGTFSIYFSPELRIYDVYYTCMTS